MEQGTGIDRSLAARSTSEAIYIMPPMAIGVPSVMIERETSLRGKTTSLSPAHVPA